MRQYSYFKSAPSISASLVTGKKFGNAPVPIAIEVIKAKDSGKIWQQRELKRSITWTQRMSTKYEIKSDA